MALQLTRYGVPAPLPGGGLRSFEGRRARASCLAHMKGSSMAKVTKDVGHLVVSLTGIQSKLGAEVAQSAAWSLPE